MTKFRFVAWQALVMLVAYWAAISAIRFGVISFSVFEWVIHLVSLLLIGAAGLVLYLLNRGTEEAGWKTLSSTVIVLASYYIFVGLEMVRPAEVKANALSDDLGPAIAVLALIVLLGRRRKLIRFTAEMAAYILGLVIVQELVLLAVYRESALLTIIRGTTL